jgi:hypothetical protein
MPGIDGGGAVTGPTLDELLAEESADQEATRFTDEMYERTCDNADRVPSVADDSPHIWTADSLRGVSEAAATLARAHADCPDERARLLVAQAIEVEIAHRRSIGMTLAGAVVSVTLDLEARRWVP